MVETTTTAITQALGVLVGAFGYHVTKNPIKKAKKKRAAKKAKRTKPFTMYDSVDPTKLPHGAEAYASYVNYDGVNEFENLVRDFGEGKHHYLSITNDASFNAAILDLENGAAQPFQAPGWYARQKARGQWRPGFYGGEEDLAEAEALLKAADIERSAYRTILAAWPGDGAVVTPGYDGHQYATNEAYDTSILLPDFFG